MAAALRMQPTPVLTQHYIQVLARDIRSTHKRRVVTRGDVFRTRSESAASSSSSEVMHVVLDGVDIAYTVQDRHVTVTGGSVARAKLQAGLPANSNAAANGYTNGDDNNNTNGTTVTATLHI
eukprot:8104016-Pyramimonas_sp.AAC.1